MQAQLKQNILKATKEKGWSLRKLERDAGLHKNFINNFLYNRSKNPGIDSIIKIANALNASIDELIGRESKYAPYGLEINNKEMLSKVTNYLLQAIQNQQNIKIQWEQFFHAIHQIYNYSLKKNTFDQDFADWFVSSQLQPAISSQTDRVDDE